MRRGPRILLVQAADLRYRGGPPLRRRLLISAYASTALTLLAALVPRELDAEVRIVDEHVEGLPPRWRADLVGISACTPSALRAYALAAEARARGATVVLGGYHPTALPEEALAHADAVVAGYAEESWPALLRDWAAGRLRRLYRDDSLRTFTTDLPAPRRDLLRRRRYLWPDTVEATRGCPGHCAFCSISGTFLGRVVRRPVARYLAELRALRGRTAVLLDPSAAEEPARLRELCAAMIPLRLRWYGAATPRVAEDGELLEALARSGCRGLLLGFESLNPESLADAPKARGRADRHREVVRALHARGIAVLGCFVFGFDGDRPDVFERTAAFVEEEGVDAALYFTLTPYPGTPLFARLRGAGRLLHEDWARYDGKHAVFRPAHLSAAELEEGVRWAWARTYRLRSAIRRLRRGPGFRQASVLAFNLGLRIAGGTFIPAGYRPGRAPAAPAGGRPAEEPV